MKKVRVVLLALVILVSFCAGAVATGNLEEIKAFLNYGITVKLDGQEQIMYDAQGTRVYPITYNGTTYVPIRAVSNMLDVDVNWDGENNTVLLGEIPTITVSNFEKGKLTGNNYVNETLGLNITIPDDWSFGDSEEMALMLNVTSDVMEMDVDEIMQQAGAYWDVFAYNAQGANFNIAIEKKNNVVKKVSMENIRDLTCRSIETALKDIYDSHTLTKENYTVAGREYLGCRIVGSINGVQVYQASFLIDCGDYLATVALTSSSEQGIAEIFGFFN
ncbi:MAG: hypothetical protein IJO50_02345 [Clostridia bacterium]|nr:hypothetical protein [Clostridia bacterium]